VGGHIEVMDELWDWAKAEKLNKDYLKRELFFFKYTDILIILCCLIRPLHKPVSEVFWDRDVGVQLTTDYKKNIKSLYEKSYFVFLIFLLKIPISSMVLEWIVGDNPQIPLWVVKLVHFCVTAGIITCLFLAAEYFLFYEVFLKGQYTYRESVLYWAVTEGHVEVLERLWLWAEEEQIHPLELIRVLFLKTYMSGLSAWHLAAAKGQVKILEKLWELGVGVQRNGDQVQEGGRTTWYLAIKGAIGNLLGLSQEGEINADELRTTVLLARDTRGKTAWQLAVRFERIEVLEKLLDLAKQIQKKTEVKNKLLLDEKMGGRPAWFLAARKGNVKVLKEVWDWAKDEGDPAEIRSELLQLLLA
jgi:hypothetical protein